MQTFSKMDDTELHGIKFEKADLQALCGFFNLKDKGKKAELVFRLKPRVTRKMVDLLVEHMMTPLSMVQLRELANPLGIKAKDAFTLQMGLADAGIGPKSIVSCINPLSPSGMKAKDPLSYHGIASAPEIEPKQLFADVDPVSLLLDGHDGPVYCQPGITVEEMKVMCDMFDLKKGGNKPELIERLKGALDPNNFLPTLGMLKVDQLKEICRIYDINGFSGKNKQALAELIEAHFGRQPRTSENVGFNAVSAKAPPSVPVSVPKAPKGPTALEVANSVANTKLPALTLPEPVKRVIIDAGNFAYSRYYYLPYVEMPMSYEGDPFAWENDWDSVFDVERPNHGLASAMRKAVLVLDVCEAHGFKPEQELLAAMMVAMIFEVVGRESEIGFRDCPKTYWRFKKASIRAFGEYAAVAVRKPEMRRLCVEALENMYHEPATQLVGQVQQVFETVHELDLFRCYPADELRKKVAAIKAKVGGKACFELVLRAENQIVATGDRLPFSMMNNRCTDYDEGLFPPCSRDAGYCLERILSIPLMPPHVAAKQKAPPKPPLPPAPKAPAPPPATNKAPATKAAGLKDRNFLRTYTKAEVPGFQDELMGPVRKLVTWFAQANDMSMELVRSYFERVQQNAFKAGADEMYKTESIPFISMRLWTTAEKLDGRIELCAILNKALRDDVPEVMEHVAVFVRALNLQCVSRHVGKHVKWPSTNTTYRGSAMPRCFRDFYVPGKSYRVPMYIATSADDEVAEEFMERLAPSSAAQQPPHQEPTMWIFHFDPVKRCKHVNFIDKTDGSVDGENEFLFVPYSVFTVRRVEWVDAPKMNEFERVFHTIEVDVAHDNTKVDKELKLPLAPWA